MMIAVCGHHELCAHNNAEFRRKLIGLCYKKPLESHGTMLGELGKSPITLSTGLGEASVLASYL